MNRIIITSLATAISVFSMAQNTLLTQRVSELNFYQLPYQYAALEPAIDALTVEIHYSRHHKAYFDNFLKQASDLKLAEKTLNEIFAKASEYPAGIRNNGGGYYNHVLYWEILKPGNRKGLSPTLNKAIVDEFGSAENLIAQMNDAALKRFGSGWAWLVVDGNGKLKIGSTPNQDNPLMDVSDIKGIPIIGIDVWEHAYYLKYQNKRAEYVKNFWSLINWEVVSRLYQNAIKNV
mgnify:FL=1